MSLPERSGADRGVAPTETVPGRRPSVGGIVLAILLVALLVWVGFALAPHVTRARVEAWIQAAGPWGPVVLLAIQVGQILAAPIPGVFVPIVAGALYGPFLGAIITAAGSCIGSAAAYWIARTGGRPIAVRLIGAEPLDRAAGLIGGKRWLALIPLLLFPLSPADALCFAAGIVGMPWKRFAIAVALGRLPKDAVLAVGAALGWNALGS
jgi:uncharacterized membrane protein YdjX (TVP38/TMEM64 family)